MDIENIPFWIRRVLSQLILFLGAYFAPLYAKGLAILIFIFIDFITGIWASHHLGKDIESRLMRKTVSKFIVYVLALIVAVIFTKEFGVDILTVVAFGLASIEVKSIFENLYKITNINFVDWINQYITKVRKDKSKK